MLVENLHEPSLVAQRMVFDSIRSSGGVMGVVIDKRLLQHVRGARSRYEEATRARKAAKTENDAKSAAKRKIVGDIKQLEIKKAKDATSALSGIADEINELRKLNS